MFSGTSSSAQISRRIKFKCMKELGVDFEMVLQDWEVYRAIRDVIANAHDERIQTEGIAALHRAARRHVTIVWSLLSNPNFCQTA